MIPTVVRRGTLVVPTTLLAAVCSAPVQGLDPGTPPAQEPASTAPPAPGTPQTPATLPAPHHGPGALSHFGLARKDCLGTARNRVSRVWFTVAGGVLSDVYYPTVDTTNVETLQYVVTDGRTFTDLQSQDTTPTVRALDPSGMACRVTSTAHNGRYTLTTDYLTDPRRHSVALRTTLTPRAPGDRLHLYVRLDATVNGNGGGGEADAGADQAFVDTSTGSPVPVALDTRTATTAANRDYARPVALALRADRPFPQANSGTVGTATDGLVQLRAHHHLTEPADATATGNVVQTARVHLTRSRGSLRATLALGFGPDRAQAVRTAGATARTPFPALLRRYQDTWRAYEARLRPPPRLRDLPPAQRARLRALHRISANVLKASEDKTYPGAVVASLASPWGQAVSAGDPAQTYFGSYREVFSRDLYHTFTGLLASGDTATARATVRFLFDRQQQPDGSFPRNSLINGRPAPDTFGVQLDEVAFPVLMAHAAGLTGPRDYHSHIRPAADFLVAHGPATGPERWEEQSGWSPSTLAAEIAALTTAATVAQTHRDTARARIYRATADHYQRNVKTWTVTSTGPLSAHPYFIRLSKNADPDSALTYGLGNGGPDADQRTVVDAGFLELPRLGVLPHDDPDVLRSLQVVDRVLARPLRTPWGTTTGFHRYGTDTPGTEDGYGDCHTGDPTDCVVEGKPWAGVCDTQAQNRGSGHVWPVLSGERGEHELSRGHRGDAVRLLTAMAGTAWGVGLVPEQAWENETLPASPPGTPPECASIGFTHGQAAGSATPLTWSAAQYVRLATAIERGRPDDPPADTLARYRAGATPRAPLALTAPAEGTLVSGTVTVTGHTAPAATVDIAATSTDEDATPTVTTVRADRRGTFTTTVEAPPGTVALRVTSTTPTATATASRTVVRDAVPGTLLFSAQDPDGDDRGPGTYAYPTAPDFRAGAFDLQAFEVYDSGPDTLTLRVRVRDLSPTFGSPLGAQLLDLYVHDPSAGNTSTQASFPARNYRLAPETAWSRLIEVQGFGQRFVDPTGDTMGTLRIRANALTRWITVTVPAAALGGTPGPGWRFAVVLTGQDGFSPDQARGFAATPQPYQFGVCDPAALAGAQAICGVPAADVPRIVDVLLPAGVDQRDILDPVGRDPVTDPVTVPGLLVP